MPYSIGNTTLDLQSQLNAKSPLVRIPDSGINDNGLIRRYLLDGNLSDTGTQKKDCTVGVGYERYAFDPFFGRKVFNFDVASHLNADYTGLPSGAEPWALMGWSNTINLAGVLCGMGYSTTVENSTIYFYTGYSGYGTPDNCNGVVGGTANTYMNSNLRVTGTGWHHSAMVYDGATLQLYIDGILQASSSMELNLVTDGVYFRIGSMPNTGTGKFRGSVCDIRFYNRSLSADEIFAIASFGG